MAHIGIIGMGKMGTSIEGVLQSMPGATWDTFLRLSEGQNDRLKACDVVIEFTAPDAAAGIISHCLEAGIPVVSGTTGWHEYHLESITQMCREKKGKLLYATNFSVGMNITFALNRQLAMIMNKFTQFVPSVKEVHHIHKKDMPSGTAFTLLGDIIDHHRTYQNFNLNQASAEASDLIEVTAIREGEVKGYHEVTWNSGREKIVLSHEAFDRKIFAEGAIMAASWLVKRNPGIYTMKDIIEV